MSENDPPSSSSPPSSPIPVPSTTKLDAIIYGLDFLIKIGKYLPWIVLGFAVINLTLAVLNFTWWPSIGWGIFNSILAFAGLIFFGQLVRRRKTHRYEYRYTGRHLHRETKKISEEEKYASG